MTVDARGTVRLYCQNELAHRHSAPPLGDVVAGEYRFVGVAARIPREPDGRTWLPCRDKHCQSWNCFEWGGDGE